MGKYLKNEQIRRLVAVLIENDIAVDALLLPMDGVFVASLTRAPGKPIDELYTILHQLNARESIENGTVPLVDALCSAIFLLQARRSKDRCFVIELLRRARAEAPAESRALHHEIGDFDVLGEDPSPEPPDSEEPRARGARPSVTPFAGAPAGAVGGAATAALLALYPSASGWTRMSSSYLLGPLKHGLLIACGAFVFVMASRGITALRTHGLGALRPPTRWRALAVGAAVVAAMFILRALTEWQ